MCYIVLRMSGELLVSPHWFRAKTNFSLSFSLHYLQEVLQTRPDCHCSHTHLTSWIIFEWGKVEWDKVSTQLKRSFALLETKGASQHLVGPKLHWFWTARPMIGGHQFLQHNDWPERHRDFESVRGITTIDEDEIFSVINMPCSSKDRNAWQTTL